MTKIKAKGTVMELTELSVDEIIDRYRIIIPYDMPDKIFLHNPDRVKRDGTFEDLKKLKPKIHARLTEIEDERKRAAEERKAKIAAIPGLKEIQNAIYEREKWHDEWNKSFDDAGGVGVGPKPKYDFTAAYRKYPRAYAYLKAEEQSYRSNSSMAMIGKRCLERVINGEDPKKVLGDMEAETKKVVEEHMAFYD